MKIAFKIYGWIWLLIVFLYLMGWSKFSLPLDFSLFIFLFIMIAVSFLFGYLGKRRDVSFLMQSKDKYSTVIVLLILFGYLINFIYARYVPLLSIVSKAAEYASFPGIPTIYPLLVTFSFFYFFIISYYYFATHNIEYFFKGLAILFCFLLIFSRSMMLWAVCGFILMGLYYRGKSSKKNNLLLYLILAVILVVLVYLFGCLGNIRSGYAWNDCSYIETLGLFEFWPAFMPKQFMWGYLYAVTPLANLNYNVINSNIQLNIGGFIVMFMPEVLSLRLFSDAVVSGSGEILLIRTYFNAPTGFVEMYYYMGIIGCYISYLAMLVVFWLMDRLSVKYRNNNPIISVTMTIFLLLSFFYNTFFYSLTSMLLIWNIIYILLKSVKLRKINHVSRNFGSREIR